MVKAKLVRVGRTYGLPNYSSVRLEWEMEVGEKETIMAVTEHLVSDMEEYAKDKGWIQRVVSI